MAELIVGAILPVLFERLASAPVLDFVKRFKGIPSKLKAWEKKLQMIQDVLVDAEEKQTANGAVKTWLDDLQDLAYDVEDLLDEFATRALELQLMAKDDDDDHAKTSCCCSKVQNLIPSCFTSLKFNRDMMSGIEDITSRLDELFERKKELELVKTSGAAKSSSSSNSTSQRPPATTCLPPTSDIIGRDEDKRRILEMMLQDDSGNNHTSFQVVSVVGMGGIGKTTLAQAVYNDDSLKGKFDVKAWVCVSQDFDVLRISQAILEAVIGSSSDQKDLNQIQLKLREELSGKKFLLVLDDVWNEKYELWDAITPPFTAGAPRSKVLVTSRNIEVVSTMGSTNRYSLKGLSDDGCWLVFSKHAMLEDADENLNAIRDVVVKRCSGLPLAAKTLGGLLRCKRKNEWPTILSSKLLELPSNKCNILPILRLSYQHLPTYLKRCFAYCAIFPQDYEFEEEELILLWIAEGFLPESRGNKKMEDLGHEYFRDLFSRSFFDQSNSNSSKYVMHDLINDLAKWVSGDACFISEFKTGSILQSEKIARVRHSSFIGKGYVGEKGIEKLHEAKRLKTFLSFWDGEYLNCYITNTFVSDLLPKMKRLRVLSLKGYYVTELPESIGNLRQLRYLNLACAMIRSLPESTCRLLNLETLILRNCWRLLKLPSGMENLINLRCLDIKGAISINEMPMGMKNLKSLRTLSNFVVGKDTCSILYDLKNLKLLSGELCISKLENANDTRECVLRVMLGLKVLSLEWGADSQDEEVAREVLKMLQPHASIEELTIASYDGKGFPYWVGNFSFSNMKVLKLFRCNKCTTLPSLEQLGSLETIIIDGFNNLKSIGPEIFGNSVKTLKLRQLPECERWEPIQENELVERFTQLQELSITLCPKMFGSLPPNLPSLVKLEIVKCAKMVVSLSNLQMIRDIEIDGCEKVVCSCPIDSKPLNFLILSSFFDNGNCLMQGIKKVGLLKIVNCEEIIPFWQQGQSIVEKPPQGLPDLISLSELCIENFPNLVSIPEVCFLPTLIKLEIRDCNALTSLPKGIKHNIESLEIFNCESLKFIARGKIPRSLRRLSLRSCFNLQCVFGDWEYGCNLSSSPSSVAKMREEHIEDIAKSLLEYLYIDSCSSLTCLSSSGMLPARLKDLEISMCSELTTLSSGCPLPKALQQLNISNCGKLELIAETFHDNTSLESIIIFFCQNLKSIPDGLQNLSRLRSISIMYCGSLESFPDKGLPNTISDVEIVACEKLQSLPNGIHMLGSLEKLSVYGCPCITSVPEEGFLTNLSILCLGGDIEIYKQMILLLQNLTSLRSLSIVGCQDAECFPEEETPRLMSSTSLFHMSIFNFPKLKYLSSPGIRNLNSLESLTISGCPNLTSFPREGLPSSLLELRIFGCPLLRERCKRGTGQEWHKIANIPCVKIDGNYIYDPEEEYMNMML